MSSLLQCLKFYYLESCYLFQVTSVFFVNFSRGPKGVWTLEAKGEKPDMNISFNDATPTKTHMALAKLVEIGKMCF